MEYEVVNQNNYQPEQEMYTPDGQAYIPNQQGYNYQQPPQALPQAPPQAQPQGQPQGQPQAPPQAPPQGQQGYQTPQQHYQQNTQSYGQDQTNQPPPVQKRPTQSGQPVQSTNLVILEGYMNNMNHRQLNSGVSRLGFQVVIEVPVFQQGQQQVNQQTGQPMTRDVKYRCQAWGNVADGLAQWPEGTPVKITGALNRWSMQDSNTGQTVWFTDVKVNRYDIL